MVFQGFQFHNCDIGINATAPSFGNVGSFVLLDSEVVNTKTVILTKSHQPDVTTTPADDSVVIENLSERQKLRQYRRGWLQHDSDRFCASVKTVDGLPVAGDGVTDDTESL